MKLLTVTVPCYNSEAYMEKCIRSVLSGGDRVEILIVDDGSKDKTGEIADRLAAEHPDIIRAIHQPNGGHGEAVNTGLRNATGTYFKVVDSDDWLDEAAFRQVLDKLEILLAHGPGPDLMLANYVYEKQGAIRKQVMRQSDLPKGKIITWSDVRRFHKGNYMMMHSTIYRTSLLRESGVVLPGHMFYVDNVYVYEPLPMVRTLYYLDVDLYRYFIGRADQSVNESVLLRQVDQQLAVNRHMIDHVDLWQVRDEKCRQYMLNYIEIFTVISSVLLLRINTPESLQKKDEFWAYIAEKDPRLYRTLRRRILGRIVNLPGAAGRRLAVLGYLAVQKVVGFN